MNKNIVFKTIMLLVTLQAGFFEPSYGMDSQKSKSSNSSKKKRKAKPKTKASAQAASSAKPPQNNNKLTGQSSAGKTAGDTGDKKKPALKEKANTSTQSGQSGTSSETDLKSPKVTSPQSPTTASDAKIVNNSAASSPAVVLAKPEKSPKLDPLPITPQVPASVGLLNVPQPQVSSSDSSNNTPRDQKRLSANSTTIKAMTQALVSQRSGRPGSPTKRPASPTRQRRNELLSKKLEAQDIQTKLELHCTALSKEILFRLLHIDGLDKENHPINRDIIDACKTIVNGKLKELNAHIKDAREIIRHFDEYIARYYPTAAPTVDSSDSKYLVADASPANESNSPITLSPAGDKADTKAASSHDDNTIANNQSAQEKIDRLEKAKKRLDELLEKSNQKSENMEKLEEENKQLKAENAQIQKDIATLRLRLAQQCCIVS